MLHAQHGNGLLRGTTDTAAVPMRSETYAAGAPTAPPESREDGEGQQPNVSPEEQAAYDRFVDNAYATIYDDKVLPMILKRLAKGAEVDPIASLATVTVQVIDRLEGSATQQGQAIGPDVLMHGGAEILEDLANLSEKAGIHAFTDDELETALYKAMDLYRSMKDEKGEIDQSAADGDFNAVVQADQAGNLDEMIPGIEKFAKAAGAGEARRS